ncbi:Sporulation kinase E [Pelotomaculum propionicicum]|uniref:histidine kinase n=1 Tax=Pelotomaculum propionicicum TaxID=258475 RepID=A0A4Y7RVI5_9FIRM|nr:PAS domain S-box protein [Peptococcaceae bacterium]TEB12921.1 Sporulation kinase E [Pelotomaculum propionicicum]
MNYNISRKTELYEYVTTTHILCIIVAVCALILSNKVIPYRNYYPLINFRFFALVCLLGFVAVLLYNSKKILLSKNPASFTLLDLVYIMISFLMVIATVYIIGDKVPYIYAVLILPIIITASSIGKTASLLAATVSTVFLVVYNIISGRSFSIAGALESNLILIMIMYVVGWFIGGLRDIEAQHRKQLETNFKKLKEEIRRREQAEEQLRKLSSALEQSPSIAVITDTGGNIEYVNRKFTVVTGYLPGEVIGKNMFEEQYGQFPEKYKEIVDTVNSGKEWREELLNKKKNGEYYWEQVSISPFRNMDGEITNFIKMAEDITQRKSTDMEMARLDQLNLVGEMAAGIGHEIRNPMTTIKGFLQLLRERDKYVQEREYFDLMISELNRANSIITEYLSLAKNKAVELKEQNLNAIINNLFPLITADALITDKNAGKELGEIPDLFLDEKEMRQMILNLVRNGLEAMPPGGNLVVKTFTDGDEVIMAVQDQGKGINPEVLEKIGTPFFTTKDDGTGLGLAVCYSIAARHKARIEIETGPQGTTFFIRFNRTVSN